MRIVEGPRGDDSRTAFVLAPDLPRHSVAPVRLNAGAWCSLALSAGWALLVVVIAITTWGTGGSELEEFPNGGALVLLPIPLYGVVFSARLLRSSDDIASYIALWPLHILALPVNLVFVFGYVWLAPSLALNVATLVLFWWEKRWWDRF